MNLRCPAFWLTWAALPLLAGSAATWESGNYSDFVKGRFRGLALTRDGRIELAPKLEPVFSSGQAAIWSLAAAPDGSVYLGAGHRGRVYRITPGGQGSVIWTAPQPDVFALAVDAKGNLYAGASPNGKVWRIDPAGKAEEFYDPKERYIWALAAAPSGELYVGAGDTGRLHRVTAAGQGEVWYESGQTHLTCLALDARGRVLAGSEPNGLLYRIEGKGKAFVLYDSSLPEIRTIAVEPDGSLYVAALGGSVRRQAAQATSAAASSGAVGTVSTSVTVTADAQTGIDLRPRAEAAKPPAPGTEAQAASYVDLAGIERSAIYRVHPDNTVETLWSSKEENVFDLTVAGEQITFLTDQNGRLYRQGADLKPALLAETQEGDPTRLLPTAQGLLAATGNLGKLFRLAEANELSGAYESPVHDAASIARWGRLDWRGEIPASARLSFQTRSGNSQRPDPTWSEWSKPITSPAQSQITSPNARYLQWRMEMSASASGPQPSIEMVAASYLPQNARPAVRSITVTPQWGAAAAKPAGAPAAAPAVSYSVTVTDTGAAASPTSSGTPTQTVSRQGNPQLSIAWQADDPDNDRLVYSLWFRGEDERDWKKIKDDLTDNSLAVDSEMLADGRYFFRVEASDRLANSSSAARSADLVSSPFIVDHTPPLVRLGAPRREGGGLLLEFTIEDSASPVRRIEASVDAGPWFALDPADGIADSRLESGTLRLAVLAAGEHVVVIRAFDSSQNAGLGKAVLR